jgi:hypothetical protein
VYVASGLRPSIIWQSLVNGTLVNLTNYASTINSSILYNVVNGTYLCTILDGDYTIHSRPATVLIKDYITWSNGIYESPTSSEIVNLYIPRGGAAILDCGTEQYEKIDWVDPYNYTLLPTQQVAIITNIDQISKQITCQGFFQKGNITIRNTRSFILHYKQNVSSKPLLTIKPLSHEVISGANVTLYCLGESTSPLNYTWYKNNDIILRDGLIPDQALILNSINETANYTCRVSNEYGWAEWTAMIQVYNVTIQILHSNPDLSIESRDIKIYKDSLNLTLSCHVNIADQDSLDYSWYYRGTPVTLASINPAISKHSKSVISFNNVSPDKMVGSVQCLVRGRSGWGSDYARIIIKDKSNPPGVLNFTQLNDAYNFQYKLEWISPSNSHSNEYELIMSQNNQCSSNNGYSYFSTSTNETCIVYDAKCDAYIHENPCVNFYIAAVTNNVKSDYTQVGELRNIHSASN